MSGELYQQIKTHLGQVDDKGRLAFVRWFLPQLIHEQMFLFDILSAWAERRAKEYNDANANSIGNGVMPSREVVYEFPRLLDEVGLRIVLKEQIR